MRRFFIFLLLTLHLTLYTFHVIYAGGLPWTISGSGFSSGSTAGGSYVGSTGVTLGKNLVNYPGFEDGGSPPTGWSFYTPSGSWSVVTDVVHSGSRAIKHTTTSVGDNFAATPEYASANIPCIPGNSIYTSAWVKCDNASGNPRIRFIWVSQTGVYLTEGYYNTNNIITGTTDWTYTYGTVTVPGGAYKLSFRCQNTGTGTVWFDDVYVENKTTAVYVSSGYYVSPAYPCDTVTTFGKISWTADASGGCTIALRTRVSDDGVNWSGGWDTAPTYTTSGSEITNIAPGRYIQFRAEMGTANTSMSPLLKEVKITSVVKGVTSTTGSPTCIVKSGDYLSFKIYFDVRMNTSNKCRVYTISEGGIYFTVNGASEGTWDDSYTFTTASKLISSLSAGSGFAGVKVYDPTTAGSVALQHYVPYALLLDTENYYTSNKIQFFPDPFSPNGDGKADKTVLMLSIPTTKTVTVRIYTLKGVIVRTLLEGQQKFGNVPLEWDGKDENGKFCPIGTYLFQVKMDNDVKTGTVILSK